MHVGQAGCQVIFHFSFLNKLKAKLNLKLHNTDCFDSLEVRQGRNAETGRPKPEGRVNLNQKAENPYYIVDKIRIKPSSSILVQTFAEIQPWWLGGRVS